MGSPREGACWASDLGKVAFLQDDAPRYWRLTGYEAYMVPNQHPPEADILCVSNQVLSYCEQSQYHIATMGVNKFDDIPVRGRARRIKEVADCTGCSRTVAEKYLEVCCEFGNKVFDPLLKKESISKTSTASTWPSLTITEITSLQSLVVLTILAKVPGRLSRHPLAVKTIAVKQLASTR